MSKKQAYLDLIDWLLPPVGTAEEVLPIMAKRAMAVQPTTAAEALKNIQKAMLRAKP